MSTPKPWEYMLPLPAARCRGIPAERGPPQPGGPGCTLLRHPDMLVPALSQPQLQQPPGRWSHVRSTAPAPGGIANAAVLSGAAPAGQEKGKGFVLVLECGRRRPAGRSGAGRVARRPPAARQACTAHRIVIHGAHAAFRMLRHCSLWSAINCLACLLVAAAVCAAEVCDFGAAD